jgi:hypothetical protein
MAAGVWAPDLCVWCPGPEPVYQGRDFESPELVFVRALDVDA